MVLADGCFDPIHLGHIRYLLKAAHPYRKLVVRVAPDRDIIAKGRQPFQSRDERIECLVELRFVSEVCDDDTLVAAIRRLRPDHLAKGADWRGKLPQDVIEACVDVGAKILYIDTGDVRRGSQRLSA